MNNVQSMYNQLSEYDGMKEIKFKVFVKSKNKIFDVYGFNKDKVFIETNDSPEHGVNIFDRDDCLLFQYIWIKDKNGKEIYKGDICKYYNNADKDGIGIIEEDHIKWISGTIAKTNIMTALFYLTCGDEFEIIGNIYENPELI